MKILLADDHALIRSGLRNELVEIDAAAKFIEAWDAQSLREMLEANPDLDLALVDLSMPGMSGASTIGALRRDFPVIPLIVLSGLDDVEDVQAVMRAGAAGFIPKAAISKVMVQAIRLVLAGGQYLPPQMLGGREQRAGSQTSESKRRTDPGPVSSLSPRQKEVFSLLAAGLSNKLIARRLGISEGTVKSHVATIFDVLNVHNRVSAVAEAQKLAGHMNFQSPPND